MANTLAIH